MNRRDTGRAHASDSFTDHEGSGPPDYQVLLAAVAAALAVLIPCDEVVWSSGEGVQGRAVVFATARPHVPDPRPWRDLFAGHTVRRQLTIPTSSVSGDACAWSLHRYGSDFSQEEVGLAERLRPLLGILERSEGWQLADQDGSLPGGRSRNGADAPRLTHRELEVLGLLAQGLTAVSIGIRLRISSGTVRKHLEHIYEKTGYRDRLLTVEYAKRSGLLAQ